MGKGTCIYIARGFGNIFAIDGEERSIMLGVLEYGSVTFRGVEFINSKLSWDGTFSLWESPLLDSPLKAYTLVNEEFTGQILAESVEIWEAPIED